MECIIGCCGSDAIHAADPGISASAPTNAGELIGPVTIAGGGPAISLHRDTKETGHGFDYLVENRARCCFNSGGRVENGFYYSPFMLDSLAIRASSSSDFGTSPEFKALTRPALNAVAASAGSSIRWATILSIANSRV
jgi:hypothetical protein